MDTRDHPRSHTTPTLLDMPELVLSKILNIVPLVCTDRVMTNRSVCAIKAASKYLGPYVDVKDVRITKPYTNANTTTPHDRLRWKNFKAWMQKHGRKLHNISFIGDVFTSHEIMSIVLSSQKLTRLNLNVTMGGPIAFDHEAPRLIVSGVPGSVREFQVKHAFLCETLPDGLRSLTLGRGAIMQVSVLPFPQGLKKMTLESGSMLPSTMDFPASLTNLVIDTKISIETWNSIPRSLKKLVLGMCRPAGIAWDAVNVRLPEELKELVFSTHSFFSPRMLAMPQSLEVLVHRCTRQIDFSHIPVANLRIINAHSIFGLGIVFPKLERLYVDTLMMIGLYGNIFPSLTHLQTNTTMADTLLPPSLRHWSLKGDNARGFNSYTFQSNVKLETLCMDTAYNLGDQVQIVPQPFDWTNLPYAWWDRLRTLAVHTHKLEEMFPHGSIVESSNVGEYLGKMTLVLVRSNPVPTYTFNERDAIMRLKSISKFIAQIDVYSETTPFDSKRGFMGSELALRMELRRLCPWARIRFVKGTSEPVWDFESVVE